MSTQGRHLGRKYAQTHLYCVCTADAVPPTYVFSLDPAGLPLSPYVSQQEACILPPASDLATRDWLVDGYPASPFQLRPFSQPYVQPQEAVPKQVTCRPGSGIAGTPTEQCIYAFEIDVVAIQKDLGICGDGTATWLLSYNGAYYTAATCWPASIQVHCMHAQGSSGQACLPSTGRPLLRRAKRRCMCGGGGGRTGDGRG